MIAILVVVFFGLIRIGVSLGGRYETVRLRGCYRQRAASLVGQRVSL